MESNDRQELQHAGFIVLPHSSVFGGVAIDSSLATAEEPVRAPICKTLKWLCRLMAILIIATAILAVVQLYFLTVAALPGSVLAWGLAVPILAMAVISTWMAFFKME